jgi:cytidylate kinase
MNRRKIIIAIDGCSSAGKSTMAKDLADEIGYTYIDTGAMYRAVALYAIRRGFVADGQINAEQLLAALPEIHIAFRRNEATGGMETYLNGINVEKEIRSMDVAAWVSPVAALPFVRNDLVAKQREMGRNGGIVMDGRDIGSTVFPQAEMKVFVTASPEIRARRRLDEMRARGEKVSFEDTLANVKARDFMDSTRSESPLRQADDALTLDTSAMTIKDQKEWLLKQYAATLDAMDRMTNG